MTQQSNQGWLDELYKGSHRMIADLSEGRAGLNESLYDEGWNDCIDHLAQRGMLNCGWMPIESAPKVDGQRLCLALWDDDNYFCWITVGWWDKKRRAWWHNPDGKLVPPTHWMPLPAAPKMEGKE